MYANIHTYRHTHTYTRGEGQIRLGSTQTVFYYNVDISVRRKLSHDINEIMYGYLFFPGRRLT